MQQDYEDGKYTVTFDEQSGALKALRYGDEWRDLSGDKLVYCMLAAHADAQAEIARLRGALEKIVESGGAWSHKVSSEALEQAK